MDGTSARRLKVFERFQIVKCLRGASLPCGCLVGVYQMYGHQLLTVIDATAASCGERAHHVDVVMDEFPPSVAVVH